jgi:hypothetical protein
MRSTTPPDCSATTLHACHNNKLSRTHDTCLSASSLHSDPMSESIDTATPASFARSAHCARAHTLTRSVPQHTRQHARTRHTHLNVVQFSTALRERVASIVETTNAL